MRALLLFCALALGAAEPTGPLVSALTRTVEEGETSLCASYEMELVNPSPVPALLQCDLRLPPGAAIQDFAFWIGGGRYEGVVLPQPWRMPKGTDSFPTLLREAGRLSWIAPGLARLRVYPVPPRGRTRVTLAWSLLRPDAAAVEAPPLLAPGTPRVAGLDDLPLRIAPLSPGPHRRVLPGVAGEPGFALLVITLPDLPPGIAKPPEAEILLIDGSAGGGCGPGSLAEITRAAPGPEQRRLILARATPLALPWAAWQPEAGLGGLDAGQALRLAANEAATMPGRLRLRLLGRWQPTLGEQRTAMARTMGMIAPGRLTLDIEDAESPLARQLSPWLAEEGARTDIVIEGRGALSLPAPSWRGRLRRGERLAVIARWSGGEGALALSWRDDRTAQRASADIPLRLAKQDADPRLAQLWCGGRLADLAGQSELRPEAAAQNTAESATLAARFRVLGPGLASLAVSEQRLLREEGKEDLKELLLPHVAEAVAPATVEWVPYLGDATGECIFGPMPDEGLQLWMLVRALGLERGFGVNPGAELDDWVRSHWGHAGEYWSNFRAPTAGWTDARAAGAPVDDAMRRLWDVEPPAFTRTKDGEQIRCWRQGSRSELRLESEGLLMQQRRFDAQGELIALPLWNRWWRCHADTDPVGHFLAHHPLPCWLPAELLARDYACTLRAGPEGSWLLALVPRVQLAGTYDEREDWLFALDGAGLPLAAWRSAYPEVVLRFHREGNEISADPDCWSVSEQWRWTLGGGPSPVKGGLADDAAEIGHVDPAPVWQRLLAGQTTVDDWLCGTLCAEEEDRAWWLSAGLARFPDDVALLTLRLQQDADHAPDLAKLQARLPALPPVHAAHVEALLESKAEEPDSVVLAPLARALVAERKRRNTAQAETPVVAAPPQLAAPDVDLDGIDNLIALAEADSPAQSWKNFINMHRWCGEEQLPIRRFLGGASLLGPGRGLLTDEEVKHLRAQTIAQLDHLGAAPQRLRLHAQALASAPDLRGDPLRSWQALATDQAACAPLDCVLLQPELLAARRRLLTVARENGQPEVLAGLLADCGNGTNFLPQDDLIRACCVLAARGQRDEAVQAALRLGINDRVLLRLREAGPTSLFRGWDETLLWYESRAPASGTSPESFAADLEQLPADVPRLLPRLLDAANSPERFRRLAAAIIPLRQRLGLPWFGGRQLLRTAISQGWWSEAQNVAETLAAAGQDRHAVLVAIEMLDGRREAGLARLRAHIAVAPDQCRRWQAAVELLVAMNCWQDAMALRREALAYSEALSAPQEDWDGERFDSSGKLFNRVVVAKGEQLFPKPRAADVEPPEPPLVKSATAEQIAPAAHAEIPTPPPAQPNLHYLAERLLLGDRDARTAAPLDDASFRAILDRQARALRQDPRLAPMVALNCLLLRAQAEGLGGRPEELFAEFATDPRVVAFALDPRQALALLESAQRDDLLLAVFRRPEILGYGDGGIIERLVARLQQAGRADEAEALLVRLEPPSLDQRLSEAEDPGQLLAEAQGLALGDDQGAERLIALLVWQGRYQEAAETMADLQRFSRVDMLTGLNWQFNDWTNDPTRDSEDPRREAIQTARRQEVNRRGAAFAEWVIVKGSSSTLVWRCAWQRFFGAMDQSAASATRVALLRRLLAAALARDPRFLVEVVTEGALESWEREVAPADAGEWRDVLALMEELAFASGTFPYWLCGPGGEDGEEPPASWLALSASERQDLLARISALLLDPRCERDVAELAGAMGEPQPLKDSGADPCPAAWLQRELQARGHDVR